jgi:hypothetical protein
MNVTVPVGVVVGDVTVAVNVTACPTLDEFTEATMDAVEVAISTTCFRAADVLAAFAVSPPYHAVIVEGPAGRADVVILATPPLTLALPSDALPLLKVTVPVGVDPAELTVAVNVTAWP